MGMVFPVTLQATEFGAAFVPRVAMSTLLPWAVDRMPVGQKSDVNKQIAMGIGFDLGCGITTSDCTPPPNPPPSRGRALCRSWY